jgi:hypothetical protein
VATNYNLKRLFNLGMRLSDRLLALKRHVGSGRAAVLAAALPAEFGIKSRIG